MAHMKPMDLSNDLDSLLRDVKAATEEVKQRQEEDKRKEALAAEKERSRKLSAIIVAVAAIALFVLAYFVVFAGSNDQSSQQDSYAPRSAPHVTINTYSQPGSSRSASNTAIPAPVTPMRPRNIPPDNYEQPRGGM